MYIYKKKTNTHHFPFTVKEKKRKKRRRKKRCWQCCKKKIKLEYQSSVVIYHEPSTVTVPFCPSLSASVTHTPKATHHPRSVSHLGLRRSWAWNIIFSMIFFIFSFSFLLFHQFHCSICCSFLYYVEEERRIEDVNEKERMGKENKWMIQGFKRCRNGFRTHTNLSYIYFFSLSLSVNAKRIARYKAVEGQVNNDNNNNNNDDDDKDNMVVSSVITHSTHHSHPRSSLFAITLTTTHNFSPHCHHTSPPASSCHPHHHSSPSM